MVLEEIKKENTVVEYYCVYDTTLSRVFLSLIKLSRKGIETLKQETKTEYEASRKERKENNVEDEQNEM